MLLIKFQKENRLIPIQQGIFHFRPTQSFRDDPLISRGDSMEGRVFGNPNGSFKINGLEISQWIESIIWSKEYEGNILSTSFFLLNMENCHELGEGVFTINEDSIEMMKSFGDSFIILNPYIFISCMKTALSKYKCNYEYHRVHYCDIRDHYAVNDYFDKMKRENSLYPEFFLKDRSNYALQNEWRFLIHDQDNEFPLTANGGVNISTEFRTEIPIFNIEQLTTLRLSKEYL